MKIGNLSETEPIHGSQCPGDPGPTQATSPALSDLSTVCIIKGFSLRGVTIQPSFQPANDIDCNHSWCVCAVECSSLAMTAALKRPFSLAKLEILYAVSLICMIALT